MAARALKLRIFSIVLSVIFLSGIVADAAWAYQRVPSSNRIGKKIRKSRIKNISADHRFNPRNLSVSKRTRFNTFSQLDKKFSLNRRAGRFAPTDFSMAVRSSRMNFTQDHSRLSSAIRSSRFSSGVSTFKSKRQVFRDGKFANRNTNISRKIKSFDAPAFNINAKFKEDPFFEG